MPSWAQEEELQIQNLVIFKTKFPAIVCILKCLPKAHVLKAWFPAWHCWELVEFLTDEA